MDTEFNKYLDKCINSKKKKPSLKCIMINMAKPTNSKDKVVGWVNEKKFNLSYLDLKDVSKSNDELLDQIKADLKKGFTVILLDNYDLYNHDLRYDLIKSLTKESKLKDDEFDYEGNVLCIIALYKPNKRNTLSIGEAECFNNWKDFD